MNIPTEPVVRGSEESIQSLRSQGQTFKGHSTFVAQLPAPYRDRSLSTTGASFHNVSADMSSDLQVFIKLGKRCGNNNKDEDNNPKTLNDKNHQASSQKF